MHPKQLQDDLWIKHFLKWCTGKEEESIGSWLGADAGNRLYYDNLVTSEKISGILQRIQKMDIDQKWEVFNEEHVSKRSNIILLYESKPGRESPFAIFILKRAINIAASINIGLTIAVGI